MDENNFIPRCPKCLLVPSIKLIYENNDCKIEYNCQNKHSDILFLLIYLKKNVKIFLWKKLNV